MKLLITLLLAFMPLLSFSQDDFEYVTKATDKSEYFVKIVNTKVDGSQVICDIWLKVQKPSRQIKAKNGKITTVNGGKTLHFIKFYFNENGPNQYSRISSTEYSSAGKVIGSDENLEILAEKNYVIPGSVMESIEKYLSENIG